MDFPLTEPGLGSADSDHPELNGEGQSPRFVLYAPTMPYGQTTVYPNADAQTYETHRSMLNRGARFSSLEELERVLSILERFSSRGDSGSESEEM